MAEAIDDKLREWVSGVVAADVQFSAPVDLSTDDDDTPETAPVVHLYLIETTPTLPPRDTTRNLLQIRQIYLVTISHAAPTIAQELVMELLFSAMQHPDFEALTDPLPLDWWQALQVRPRAAFRLKTYIQRERATQPAPPVRQPLVLKTGSVHDLYGQVLSPDDTPLAGVTVRCAALNRQTTTDHSGRFSMSGVAGSLMLDVRTGQHTTGVRVTTLTTPQNPLIIRVDPLQPVDA